MNVPFSEWMRRALVLAERGRGAVEPNPLVGAVVVRDGVAVGEGFHERFGGPHAEVNALAAAGEAARGATVYVTLEPCCHFGKTPPCTDALLRAGVARVVAAMADPFPKVAGQGAEILRQAGVDVDLGLCEAEARELNAAYVKLLAVGRPYVHAKWAMTLDGKICTRTGDSRWISNEASRRRVHELRGQMDAIIVGIGTALADDPLLTARPPGRRTPYRVVLDHHARLPLDCQLVQTAAHFPTWICCRADAPAYHVERLRSAGCEVVTLADGPHEIGTLLASMGQRRWTNILIEGGAGVLGSFIDERAVDRVHVFLAPRLVGGAEAKSPIAGRGVRLIAEGLPLLSHQVELLEDNVYVQGVLHRY